MDWLIDYFIEQNLFIDYVIRYHLDGNIKI